MAGFIVRWWKRLVALGVALVALGFMLSGSRHDRKQEALGQKAEQLEHDRGATINEALAARKRQEAARSRAEAAQRETEARIKQLEDSDETLAMRVRAYNQRRLRQRKSP